MKCGGFWFFFYLSFSTIGPGGHVLVRDVLVLSSDESKVHPGCYISCDNNNNECLSRSIRDSSVYISIFCCCPVSILSLINYHLMRGIPLSCKF